MTARRQRKPAISRRQKILATCHAFSLRPAGKRFAGMYTRSSSQLPYLQRCVGTCVGHWHAAGSFRSNCQVATLGREAGSWTWLRDGERIGALNPLLQRWGAACPSWRSPPWSPAPSSRWRYFRGSGENGSRIAAKPTPAADLPIAASAGNRPGLASARFPAQTPS
jgi:hypothetical protein